MSLGGLVVATHRGTVELYQSPGFVRATGEKPMSDDPDFPKAIRPVNSSVTLVAMVHEWLS
jgi:hypothetical protein